MIIHKMTASYGKLNQSVMTLRDGLNIIFGPNESGKSTWVSFLFSMLYGIDTRERKTADNLPDKIKYQPWGGQPMSGVMELTLGGRDYTVERATARSGAPMQNFSAYDTKTGRPAPFSSADAGAALCGVEADVYIRSAYIGKTGLPVGQSSDLEKRIESLFSSGDEQSSYSEANSRLKDWLNKKSRPHTGEVSRLSAELASAENQLGSLTALAQKETALHGQIAALEARGARLSESIRAHLAFEAAGQREQALRAKADYDALRLETEKLETTLRRNGIIPDASFIRKIRDGLARLHTLKDHLHAVQARVLESDRLDREAREALDDCPEVFSGLSPDQARDMAQQDTQRAAALKHSAEKKQGIFPAFMPAALLLILTLASLLLFPAAALYGAAVTLIAAAAGVVFSRRGRTEQKENQEALCSLLRRYGCVAPDEIIQAAADYRERSFISQTRAQDAQTETGRAAQARTQYDEALAQLKQASADFLPDIEQEAQLESALNDLESKLELLSAVRRDRDIAKSRVDILPFPENSGDGAPRGDRPEGIKEQLEAELDEAGRALSARRQELASVRGEMRHFGDPASLAARIEQLRSRIALLETESEAIKLAMAALEGASSTRQAVFSPPLSERTGRILSAFTGGRYEKALIQRQFTPHIWQSGQMDRLDVLSLSRGTADQLYLALRLAIYDLTMPEDNRPPMVLDDALLSFDRQRKHSALSWLRAQAVSRQILLFSCHSDEADYFQDDPAVHIIRL